nr:immunoglobulin heavy chain junction region [Mus musculus]MBK4190110.1 immunoglobulin heavy chain junction region [Mus musculus]
CARGALFYAMDYW